MMKIPNRQILFTFVGIVALLSVLALTLFLHVSNNVKLNIDNKLIVEAETRTFLGVNWLEKEWFLHGVNMPWIRWGCDFGGPCSDGYDGVSQESVQQQIREKFETLQDANVHVVRWWLFPQFNYGLESEDFAETIIVETREIRLDDAVYYQYFPIGISSHVFTDIDTALAIADEYDIYYNFTIFSSMNAIPREWVLEQEYRDALVRVLGELFARYANHPRILAWEVVNEPEYASSEYGSEEATLYMDEIIRFVADIVTEQRRVSPITLVNIGPAFISNTREDYRFDIIYRWFQSGINPDFISPHYYDYMDDNINIFRTNANSLRSLYGSKTIPIVIGEGYLGEPVDANERLETVRSLGYAGFWGWSLFPESTYDRMEINWDGVSTYGNNYSDNGPRQTAESPTDTPTNTPTSTLTNTPTNTPSATLTATRTNTPTNTPTNIATSTTNVTSTPTNNQPLSNNTNNAQTPTPTKRQNINNSITNTTITQPPPQTDIPPIAQNNQAIDDPTTTQISSTPQHTEINTSQNKNNPNVKDVKQSNNGLFTLQDWLFYFCWIILFLLIIIPLFLFIINENKKRKKRES